MTPPLHQPLDLADVRMEAIDGCVFVAHPLLWLRLSAGQARAVAARLERLAGILEHEGHPQGRPPEASRNDKHG